MSLQSAVLDSLLPRDGDADATPACSNGNDYDGRMGVRVSAIFVILVGSLAGSWFPVFAKRHRSLGVPSWAFFIAKYFGSGVIIATAFIHLLGPAEEALTDPCLTGPITEYSWVEGIILMTVMVMFLVELMCMRYGNFGEGHAHDHEHDHAPAHSSPRSADFSAEGHKQEQPLAAPQSLAAATHQPGEDHLGHARSHKANSDFNLDWEESGSAPESYSAQLTAIFILEFGVIFHSIFIGLTLAVSGEEFTTLYVVLVFHQTFEGLGLGSRLATVPWPRSKRWTPYILGVSYALSTPIAIAIGLGVRQTFTPGSRNFLITNGIFDSISAGILIYTGLVELLAHEFMFSPSMNKAPIKVILAAVGLMWLGAALMALLGKWA